MTLPKVLSGQPRENWAVRQSKLSKLPRRQGVYTIKATTSSKSGLYSEAFTAYRFIHLTTLGASSIDNHSPRP